MTGNNTLTLNEATMITALSYWLRMSQFATDKCPKVASVKPGPHAGTFVVHLVDRNGDKP